MVTQEQILAKIEPKPNSGCWLWQGNVIPHGYGLIRPIKDSRKSYYVHRIVYTLWYGDIPLGKYVLHHCDVRSCCNPTYLLLGTQQDNATDACRKGRMNPPIGKRNVWRVNPQALYVDGKHKNARLSIEQVRALRNATKGNIAALCRHYGIDVSTACHRRARRRWKHMEN